MPYAGSLIASEKTDALVIACGRCDRAARYPAATAIEKHGQRRHFSEKWTAPDPVP